MNCNNVRLKWTKNQKIEFINSILILSSYTFFIWKDLKNINKNINLSFVYVCHIYVEVYYF